VKGADTPLPPALNGMLAALADHPQSLNPYEAEDDRSEWACGWEVVQTHAQRRVDRFVELQRLLTATLGPGGASPLPPVQPMTEAARHRFVVLSHFRLAHIRLIRERDAAEQGGRTAAARTYNHAVNIVGQEIEGATLIFSRIEGEA